MVCINYNYLSYTKKSSNVKISNDGIGMHVVAIFGQCHASVLLEDRLKVCKRTQHRTSDKHLDTMISLSNLYIFSRC